MGGRAGDWSGIGAAERKVIFDCKWELPTSTGDAGRRLEPLQHPGPVMAETGHLAVSGTPLLLEPAVRAHKHLCLPCGEGSPFILMFQRRNLYIFANYPE